MTTRCNTPGKALGTESRGHEAEEATAQMQFFALPDLKGFSALTMLEHFMQ